MKPLLRAHPELEIIDRLPLFIEYRIYNYKLCRKGTGKIRYGYGYSYWDVVSLVVFYFLWNRSHSLWLSGLAITLFVRMKTTQLIWESIRVLPHLGVQIESSKGVPIPFSNQTWAVSTSRNFIPMDEMHDVLINEGLHRWDWYFYLTILRRTPRRPFKDLNTPCDLSMAIAFRQTLPVLDVVREVYHGVRETLFDEYEEVLNADDDNTIARNVQEI